MALQGLTMRLRSRIFQLLALIMLPFIPHSLLAMSACEGELYNPITATNWSNLFPMTIMGVKAGTSYPQSPYMAMPSFCKCPSHFMGAPMIGVGITYWEPMFVAEVERSAGCLSTIGGEKIFGDAFSILDSEQDSTGNIGGSGRKGSQDKATRMQVHWYDYPVFATLKLFTDFACLSRGNFAVANFTEVNPIAQNDMWSLALAPDALFWTSWAAQLTCPVESITAAAGFPLDFLQGCVGSAGSMGPPALTAPDYNSSQMGNMLILAKAMSMFHRTFMLWQSIGPGAICAAHPNPFLVKSQYRLDPIGPVARQSGAPIQFGKSELLWNFPPMNYPTAESSQYLVWQARQCCLRL